MNTSLFKNSRNRDVRAHTVLAVVLVLALAIGSGAAAAKPTTSPAQPRVCAGSDDRKSPFEIPPEIGIASSAWNSSAVGLKIPLENASERTLSAVQVTSVRVSNAVTLQPVAPVELGDVDAEEIRLVDAVISDRDGHLQKKYHVEVSGKYRVGGSTCVFSVAEFFSPQVANDDATFVGRPGTTAFRRPQNAFYPPPPVDGGGSDDEENNAETPTLIPPGPNVQLFPATATPSSLGALDSAALVEVDPNKYSTSNNNEGIPPDPNAARSTNNVVLTTFNTGISYSLDGGTNFTDVNLKSPVAGEPGRTSFFPELAAGVCCDQSVIYVPQYNLFVWLLLYRPLTVTTTAGTTMTTTITQSNLLRIAFATPEAIIANFNDAWTYGDLTPNAVAGVSSGLGLAANEWLDFPDVAFSQTYLYLGVDHGFPNDVKNVYASRRIVARLPLAQMADPAATGANYGFTELSGSNGLAKTHFVQGAPDRMVVAALDNTSRLRVFTWEDTAPSTYARTTAISSITTNYSETAPDGTDWYATTVPGAINAATYRNGSYVFAFDGGKQPGRPRAYVRLETVTPTLTGHKPVSVTEEYDMWNADFAVAMAALGTQGNDIGIGIAVGGGTVGFPQFAVGLKDDYVFYVVTNSDTTQTVVQNNPDGSTTVLSRFGDYFSVRPIPGTNRFAAASYDVVQNPTGTSCRPAGCSATARYTEFGRPEGPD